MTFYSRTIKLQGIVYKQISPDNWQNLATGEILNNTQLSALINQFKRTEPISEQLLPLGACCEIIDGIMVCSEKSELNCLNGCFKGLNSNCSQGCTGCVHCCFETNGCLARRPSACLNAGGTYFGSNGCTGCKFGVCSSDPVITRRFYGNGCTGIFIEGGNTGSFDQGIYCTGSGAGQTCFGPGQRYQQFTSNFIQGGTCSDCILGACCTGGNCAGITSQSACAIISGLFFPGQTCGRCDFGVYCTGAGVNRTCIRTGYRGEEISNEFAQGATCSFCTMGTCCVNGEPNTTRQSQCSGNFFTGIFNVNACDTGSCCVGATCTENVFRYDCSGVFNSGLTCIACGNGACCLPGGGCTLTTMGSCMATGGIFFGGQTCSACDTGVCCQGECTDQRRGNVCSGTFYQGVNCNTTPCRLGACCVNGTCIGNTPSINCLNLGGIFFGGQTCIACATGANCTIDDNDNPICISNQYFGNVTTGRFFQNQGCSACDEGSCCNQNGGGQTGIRGDCTAAGASFFAGQTLFICDAGVFCTGSTCFGLGYRGQSLTNNFIAGATCSSCILGACCTGGTCLGAGLTSQAACNSVGGLFYAGATCRACDLGAYCTGSTCFGLGFRGQSLTNNFIAGATCSSCILGACCTGGTCSGGGQTSQAACNGLFFAGATCRACDYGIYCTGATCLDFGYRNQVLTNNFIVGATCSSCILGACCTGGTCLGGGQTSQAACLIAGGTFYVGATCFQCDMGIFCTGSGIGQTCFGSGHRGQSLTNNFIAGATCSSCILGACCTGGTCLGGGLTSQAACVVAGGFFYAGTTCVSCDYGVYCTGSNETTSCIGFGYRAQNLSNQFIIQGNCDLDCLYGSCCDGITCLGITSARNCPSPYNFYSGSTCSACDTGLGACCTGGNSSITTSTVCASQGGVFFPQGTTALCVTGSCCTGGTCIQEITGRSGNCQLFRAGATCAICDTGVFCTGSTCFGTGFRGQSLTSNFILGATCSSCILGACCTGGTCLGGGLTSQANCPSSVGSFVIGATNCNVCGNRANCCINNVHSYIFSQDCLAQGGVIFEGTENSSLCDLGVFCELNACEAETLRGYNLSDKFIVGGNCDECVEGTCCDQAGNASYQNSFTCTGIFTPGPFNSNLCQSGGETYGICCVGGTCSIGIEEESCDGYFIPNTIAEANQLSCETNICELGVCCKENNITSVTGGVCLGEMTRAECSLTGGSFLSYEADGATCSNCLYIPMLTSAVFYRMATDLASPSTRTTNAFLSSETGFTGNEIQPANPNPAATRGDTWLSSNNTSGSNYYGAGATTTNLSIYRKDNQGKVGFNIVNPNFAGGIFAGSAASSFSLWYNSGVTLHNPSVDAWMGTTFGVFDPPPDFSLGIRSITGRTLGYVLGANNTLVYQVPRYLRIVLGYGNPDDAWYGTVLVARWMGSTFGSGTTTRTLYALDDATLHAGLCGAKFNKFPTRNPFFDTNTLDVPGVCFSSPVLVQTFAENPLSYKIRPVGSCCKGVTCIGIVTQDHCTFVGGTFYENGQCNSCYPLLLVGNCCTGGTFFGFTNEAACNAIGGYFKRGRREDRSVCNFGTVCGSNESCIAPNIYRGQSTGGAGTTFIQFAINRNLGCEVCNQGICCVGQTCNGYIPKPFCDDVSGTFYANDTSCGQLCITGVCCDLETSGCGTFTNQANCQGPNKLFFVGYTAGQTCSACSSFFELQSNSSGVTYTYTFNKGTTYGTFWDGSLWVQETNDLKLLNVRLKYDDAQQTYYTKIVGGKEHSVALTRYSNVVHGFGDNTFGQSGVTKEFSFRKTYNYLGEGFKDIAAGFYHTLAISNGGTVSAWGRNIYGESTVPAGLTGVVRISAGEYHSVALSDDGGVTCWGSNILGECNVPSGLTGVTMISCGANHTLALKADGTVVAWGDNSQGQCSVPAGLTGVRKIAAGYYHSLAIFGASAGLTSWGRSTEGQRGIPYQIGKDSTQPTTPRFGYTDVVGGGYYTMTLRPDENRIKIEYAGSNSDGQATYLWIRENPTYIAAGEKHSLSINPDGYIMSWGSNSRGQTDIKILAEYKANTKISNIPLTSSGYLGSVYIHGVDKNPLPRSYVDNVVGIVPFVKQKFISINYDNYDKGWKGPFTSSASENAANYPAFDLTEFERNSQRFGAEGFTLEAGDVMVCNTTNFNIYSKYFPENNAGYPYQVRSTRANTLVYGLLNCLSATGAALAGSTSCFRPPVSWLPENKASRPIYALSSMEGRIPGQPGNTLIGATSGIELYTTLRNQLASSAQYSEFGDGTDYGVVTPMWAMAGYGKEINSYGEQYVLPLTQIIETIYATGSVETRISLNQRRELLTKVVQYGIDSWGAQRAYTLVLSSGAGQKPCRTRPWIPLAGYYLGVTAMYDPESTMINEDPVRLNHLVNAYYTSDPAQLPGRTSPAGSWYTPENPGVCSTKREWRLFRFGDTGSANNSEGLRRFVGRMMSHEVNTSVEIINDRSNLLRHYEYVGAYYKNTKFDGFGPSGPTGVTFYNELSNRVIVDRDGTNCAKSAILSVYGNFGVIRWGSGITAINPFSGKTLDNKGKLVDVYRFNYESKDGYKSAWESGWLRVEGGPGSSGPAGATMSRFYKVLYSNGFRSDSCTVQASVVPGGFTSGFSGPTSGGQHGGWQIVIGQTWADGIPDHTSIIKFYPFIEDDLGTTRPCFTCPQGFTYSKIMYFQNNNPESCPASEKSESILYDAALHQATPYLNNSLIPWISPYFLAEYITRTKGVTLISDVTNITDHLRQFIYTSPYNIGSMYWYFPSGINGVVHEWMGVNLGDMQAHKSRINFAKYYPGIITWNGFTV